MSEKENKSNPTLEQQFLKAYDEYAKALWRHAYFRVSNRELAEDLVSETFTRAWNNYREKPVENLRALLYRILHNLIIDYYRQFKPTVSLDNISELPHTSEPSLIKAVELHQLEQYLQKLPEMYRQVLVWRYIDDLSIKEISRLSCKTITHTYVIIHRALKQLRQLVESRL